MSAAHGSSVASCSSSGRRLVRHRHVIMQQAPRCRGRMPIWRAQTETNAINSISGFRMGGGGGGSGQPPRKELPAAGGDDEDAWMRPQLQEQQNLLHQCIAVAAISSGLLMASVTIPMLALCSEFVNFLAVIGVGLVSLAEWAELMLMIPIAFASWAAATEQLCALSLTLVAVGLAVWVLCAIIQADLKAREGNQKVHQRAATSTSTSVPTASVSSINSASPPFHYALAALTASVNVEEASLGSSMALQATGWGKQPSGRYPWLLGTRAM